ncbi:aromatic acid exporter family protein [Nonomuraea sp. NPDC050547]|uniref:FUSC family protein n=1 Tax=unclassified Nonomuraea TaxID=2593643 RepID=UPI0037ADE971
MSERWGVRLAGAARRELRYVRQQVTGLGEQSSSQRLELRQIAKATAAAVLAWLIADRLLARETVWFAPATAVIMVHATVYRTVTNGLRRVGAVAAGVFLAGSIGHLLGLNALSLVLVVPPALIAARWHRMGRHGSDVATTAVLMLSFGAASQERYLAGYLVATVIGALCGAGVNALIWPPLYLRRPFRALRGQSREAAALLESMAAGLKERCDLSRLPEWETRAAELDARLVQTREAITDGVESRRYNLRRSRHPAEGDHAVLLSAMSQAGVHVHAIVRALAHIEQQPGVDTATGWISVHFARDYAELLDTLAAALVRVIPPEPDDRETAELLSRAREKIEAIHRQMTAEIRAGEVERPQGWAASGSLLTDAERILALLTRLTTPATTADESPASLATP